MTPTSSEGEDPRAPEGIAAGALTLARIRATGQASAVARQDELVSAATAAAHIDRQLLEVRDASSGTTTVVLGWADGAGPDPDQHPSAPPPRLPVVPHLVWAVCLAGAWPDAVSAPYPGLPFRREQVLKASVAIGAHHGTVVAALDRTLPRAGLISHHGPSTRLGPAAAALPTSVWSALRRIHDRLPHAALAMAGSVDSGEQTERGAGGGVRRLPCPPSGPPGPLETMVRAAVTALEIAQGPVAASDLPAFRDPAVRRAADAALADSGRTLISTPRGDWTTGYLDVVSETLAAERTGTLSKIERAVLALILLRTVAVPRAQGNRLHDGWTDSDHPVVLETLTTNRHLTQTAITEAIRGLRAAGYVATVSSGGYVPGPALARLSATARQSLWEDLVILGRPDGYLASQIRGRRASAEPHRSEADDSSGQVRR
jgi:hypothetical protein